MKSLPTCLFCLAFYFVALIVLAIHFLPADAFAVFGVIPEAGDLRITILLGAPCMLIGVTLHLICYRWSPERFDVASFRFVSIGMVLLLAGMFALSWVLSRTTNLDPAMLSGLLERSLRYFLVGAVLIAGVFILSIYLWLKRYPANRIARRISRGDYVGALEIGESMREEQRDFTTKVNLALAYAYSGQVVRSRQLLEVLESTDEVPKHYTEETFKQAIVLVRTVIDTNP